MPTQVTVSNFPCQMHCIPFSELMFLFSTVISSYCTQLAKRIAVILRRLTAQMMILALKVSF